MGLESSLRAYILTVAPVAALVGNKVRPLVMAAKEKPPFVTYEIQKSQSFDTLSDGPADYRLATVELGVYGRDYDQVADLSELLVTHLDGKGTVTTGTEMDLSFDDETETDPVYDEGKSEPSQYVRVQTFTIMYRPAPPPPPPPTGA
ncbi:MAG: hypothetical protein JWO31_3642 [Phycisphaerales bacterium]|nr:hypothetical protein [Phycisphaerales bacterium]